MPESTRPSKPESSIESSEGVGSRSETPNRAAAYYERGEESLRECMAGREGGAILLALAGGFGLGLVIGSALGRSQRQSQSWRNRIAAEGFGRRLMERVESFIPEALAEHFPK